jgi:hypothetical protein
MSLNFDNFDNLIKSHTTFLNNEYISSFLILTLILYSSIIAPKLPNYIIKMSDNSLIKFFVFFLIVYISNKNLQLAVTLTIAFFVTLNLLHNMSFTEGMENTKTFKNSDGCICSCDCNVSSEEQNKVKKLRFHLDENKEYENLDDYSSSITSDTLMLNKLNEIDNNVFIPNDITENSYLAEYDTYQYTEL